MSTETKTKTATYLGEPQGGWAGDARWYRLSEPMPIGWYEDDEAEGTTEYVIVSASHVPYTGLETYIFPANDVGEITDWGELRGSYRGGLDHGKALRGAGYTVA